MARYIDADKLIKHLRDEIDGCEVPPGSRAVGKSIAYGTVLGLQSAISFAQTLSTVDVVPKSEYDNLKFQFEALDHECDRLEMAESRRYDAFVEAKSEFAREIFEEIENILSDNHHADCQMGDCIEDYYDENLRDDIAALKKKYTERSEGE